LGGYPVAAMSNSIYRKLTPKKRNLGGFSQAWLGPDHLLLIKSSRIAENYQRFSFADIQAIVIQDRPDRTVWQAMGLDERLAQLASAYGVASGVTAAAVRLGAIGALDGQKVLRGCLPLIDTLVARPVPDDAGLSSFVPFLEIAAARHARADLRLFAN